jgi:putative flavoprotein involved in K+ transport
MNRFDVIVIGGGQSGLAMGYYLRRTGLSYMILDNEQEAGGAWQHTWKSLKLFSPAQWSSLPGMIMQGGIDHYPSRDSAIAYLKQYETKYNLLVKRPVKVFSVLKTGDYFTAVTSDGEYIARVIVSATGSFTNPFTPAIEGCNRFKGELIHSSEYQTPEVFKEKRVAIVGEGNSGAHILAEVSKVTDTIWITSKEPRFLPDHIDGRFLFDAATQMYESQKAGKDFKPPSLGDIVMVDSVKEARSRNVLKSVRPFSSFTENSIVWTDGHQERVDAVIFCTGFRPALEHLGPLNVINNEGKAGTFGTRSKNIDGLWLVGYGNWTGFASATLIGVGRSAKAATEEITEYVKMFNQPKVS